MASFDKTVNFLAGDTGAHPTWIMGLLEASKRVREDLAAPQPEPPAPQQRVTAASSTEHEASAFGLAPPSDGDPNWFGRQLLEAIQQAKKDPAAQRSELSATRLAAPAASDLVVDAAQTVSIAAPLVPAIVDRPSATMPVVLPRLQQEVHAVPAAPSDVPAALLAMERATTEDEAVAAFKEFFSAFGTECEGGTPPLVVLTAAFGAEDVATVSKVCEDAAVELDAEAEAAGGVITDRAAKRIADGMVQRLTRRDARVGPRLPDARRALLARRVRAPRAHRGHRRAVRLAAEVSAGDGPPPEEPRPPTNDHNDARPLRARDAAARSHTSERGEPRWLATSDRQAGGLQ